MRLFVAFPIDQAVNEAVSAWIEKYWSGSGIRFISPANRHITLRFLGKMDPAKLATLTESVKKTAAFLSSHAKQLEIAELGFFPNMKRAKVFWLGIKDQDCFLSKAYKFLEKELLGLGISVEARTYHAHLTLARLRVPFTAQERKIIEQSEGLSFGDFLAKELVLYRSHLSTSGAQYEPLVVCEL